MITIQSVDENNRKAVLALSLFPEQEGFVESTGQCLEEADSLVQWKPTAIYADGELVGFAMYGLWENEGEHGRMWLDRYLIDYRHQGKGYGKQALHTLINLIFKEYGSSHIYLSLYKENQRAEALYRKAGFEYNGEKDIHGELVMVLPRERWEP